MELTHVGKLLFSFEGWSTPYGKNSLNASLKKDEKWLSHKDGSVEGYAMKILVLLAKKCILYTNLKSLNNSSTLKMPALKTKFLKSSIFFLL